MSFVPSVFFVYCILSLFAGIANGITNLADVSCGQQLMAHHPKTSGGLREKRRQAKIVNGTEAYAGEYPWIVSIKFKKTNAHFCAGSLIHKRYILSAAHCFLDFKDGYFSLDEIKVTLGEHDLSERDAAINSVEVGVEELIFHQEFKIKGFVNDIVLVRLQTDVRWSPFVRPVCLPDIADKFLNSKASVAGWGRISDKYIESSDADFMPNVLQKVDVPILANAECKNWFIKSNVNWSPSDSHLCAGYQEGGKDSCQGDSGGGLTIRLEQLQKVCLVGIVSAGRGCGRPFQPGIYIRVSSYLNWIESKIAN